MYSLACSFNGEREELSKDETKKIKFERWTMWSILLCHTSDAFGSHVLFFGYAVICFIFYVWTRHWKPMTNLEFNQCLDRPTNIDLQHTPKERESEKSERERREYDRNFY